MKKDLFFVIVTYRPDKEILQDLISKIAMQPVILIDNTINNRGYGGGANKGISEALNKGARWVIILNQDVRVTKRAIKRLIETLETRDPGVVGAYSGSLDPKRWTTILPGSRTDYLSGSLIAIHAEVLKKIGGFYEPYFLYYEEVDLCLRAKNAGFQLTSFSEQEIKHQESSGLGSGSFLHQYYLARNHLLLVKRQAPMFVKLYEALRLPKTIIEHMSRGEWGSLRGLLDYMLGKFGRFGD